MNEYFETLGIDETASLEDIKVAYRRCLKLYHPDTYVGDKSDAEGMTRKVIDAYRAIISKKSRAEEEKDLKENLLQKKDKIPSVSIIPKTEKKSWGIRAFFLLSFALLIGFSGSITWLQNYYRSEEISPLKSSVFSEKTILEGVSATKQFAIKNNPESYSIHGKDGVLWRVELAPRVDGPRTWFHVFALKNATGSPAIACLIPVDAFQLTVDASLLLMSVGDSADKLENGCFRLMQNSEANILIETDKKVSSFSLEIGKNQLPINKTFPSSKVIARLIPENVTDVPKQSGRLTVDETFLAKDWPIEGRFFGDPIVRPLRLKEPAATSPTQQGQVPQPQFQSGTQNAALAQRAALLVDAPDDPQRVRTYVGKVLWRLDNVNRGPGQPISVGVRAEVELPDAKLKAVILIQKNSDNTLPDSHTIEVRFTPTEGGPIPGVAQISTPQMRKEDTPAGDALTGVPARILRNFFLVGLTRGESATIRNADLIRDRGWIDIPMLLSDQRIAKITFEKGTAGERVVNEALDAWQRSSNQYRSNGTTLQETVEPPVKPAAVASAPPAQTSSAAGAGTGFSVQLAGTMSVEEAEDAVERLTRRFSSELGFYRPSVMKADVGSRTVYRVRVRGMSSDDANMLCAKLKSGGGSCFVARD